jgi:hypothetical protein
MAILPDAVETYDDMNANLSIRHSLQNPDHHIWNNNGTYWVHATVHFPDYTKQRIRRSLKTRSIEVARQLRDALLQNAAALARS